MLQANFHDADLRQADLRWANFRFANFDGARLEGARLEGATWTDGSVCAKGSIGRCVPESTAASAGAPRSAATLIGPWYMEAETHEVEIVPCGGHDEAPMLCVRLVRAGWNKTPDDKDVLNPDIGMKDQRVNGSMMVPDLVPDKDGTWVGHIYNPGKGRSFDMRLTILDAHELRATYYFREDGHQNKHERRWFRERS
jgi:uncharacterized protein (DUF2147 family)